MRRTTCWFLAAFAICVSPSPAAQITATWSGTANWTSTANWSLSPSMPAGFEYPDNDAPNAGDTYVVDIGTGVPTVDSGAISIDVMNLSDVTLAINSPGSLNLVSTATNSSWNSGTLNGTGSLNIRSGATMMLGTANSTFLGTTINNDGTLSFAAAGTLIGASGAAWYNKPGSVFDLQTDANLSHNAGIGPVFSNSSGARFQKSGGNGTSTIIGWRFDNSGDVLNSTTNGKLNFSVGGVWGGTTTITNAAATVQMSGEFTNHILADDGSVSGAGTFLISGGTYFVGRDTSNTFTINSPFTFSNGAIHGPGALNVTNSFTLSGGLLDGSFILPRAPGSFTWSGGTLAGGASVVTTLNGSSILSSDNNKFLGRTVDNNGNVMVTGRGTLYGNYGTTRAVWNNKAGAVFDLQADASLGNNGGAGAFTNNSGATFQKSGGSFASIIAWTFNNSGTVRVESGFLWFTGTVSNLVGPSLIGAHWNVSGPSLVGGDWEVINGPAVVSTLALTGTTVTTLGNGTIPTAVLLDRNNHTSNAAFSTINGLNNITANASFMITNGQTFSVGGGGTGTMTNAGTLTVGMGSTLFAGTINSTGAIMGNGTLNYGRGSGAVSIMLAGGSLSPGESAGELTVSGDLNSNSDARFYFEIGGSTQANSSLGPTGIGAGHYDVLNIAGALTLGPTNPTLDVALLDGFIPSAADKFWIIDSANTLSATDTFAGLPDGATLLTSDGSGSFVIHYNQDGSGANPGAVVLGDFRRLVPEPSSLMLCCLAAASVSFRRQRRGLRRKGVRTI